MLLARGVEAPPQPDLVPVLYAKCDASNGYGRQPRKAATDGLEEAGKGMLAAQVLELVVVKVEATGDAQVERKAVTVLVGAEEHRGRLEELLKRRRLLTGN